MRRRWRGPGEGRAAGSVSGRGVGRAWREFSGVGPAGATGSVGEPCRDGGGRADGRPEVRPLRPREAPPLAARPSAPADPGPRAPRVGATGGAREARDRENGGRTPCAPGAGPGRTGAACRGRGRGFRSRPAPSLASRPQGRRELEGYGGLSRPARGPRLARGSGPVCLRVSELCESEDEREPPLNFVYTLSGSSTFAPSLRSVSEHTCTHTHCVFGPP